MDKLGASNKIKLTVVLVGGLCSLVLYHMKKKLNFSHFLFSKKWFSEFSLMWPGQAFSLEIKKVIHQAKSKYQVMQNKL
ncbi:spermidine synthase, putative [Plasmodium ovale wallikeri]|uniref:Spermidine synthase, putative n=1 Tax=Plasmodium ovale wallikeri TaxID=864142 RepID=A0A1A8YW51_PLAOA|nr:spermidine synthase, putative [Plasmodium ovale wallikeri]SBT35919.1 spermidine synthase, putative [Plasmodium ovale wallikeri]